MLSAIRIRIHVTPSTIIATFALVFAMSGGAYAANKYLITSTKQISPKVLKSLKGASGKAGANGANGTTGPAGPGGPAGPTGPGGLQGPQGVQGEKGVPGEKGKNGTNGTTGFTETLPSGKTETGAWAVGPEQTKNTYAPLSFTIPLEKPLDETHAHFVNEGATAPAGCTGGTAAAPTAESGNLCVYVKEALHLSVGLIKDPASGELGAGTTGALVLAVFTESGEVYGTWAVTG
jgi:Collagen triple helix repeat (20 copies)